MPVIVVPTLDPMVQVYALNADGGPASPRFRAHRTLAASVWGVSEYNPMAHDAALPTVQALQALGAEACVADAVASLQRVCEVEVFTLTMAIAVASRGRWTEKLQTEVHHAVSVDRKRWHGIVRTWAGEPVTQSVVEGIACAEAVRVLWSALQAPSSSFASIVAREGLAGVLATGAMDDAEDPSLAELADRLAGSTDPGTTAAFLFGDDVAKAMGWVPLGVPLNGGQRWAMTRAIARVEALGCAQALRLPPHALLGIEATSA